MPSQLVQFRVQQIAGDRLNLLSGDDDKPNSLAAERLERYFALTGRAVRDLRLTHSEALLLCDVLRSTWVDTFFWAESGPSLLAAELSDAAEDGLGEKWQVDIEVFAARVQQWHPVTVLAVSDAVQAWWKLTTSSKRPHSWDEALLAVGLQHHPSPLNPTESDDDGDEIAGDGAESPEEGNES